MVQDAAEEYGKWLGLTFQVVDDMLDFTSTKDILGKPVLNDLKQARLAAPRRECPLERARASMHACVRLCVCARC